MRFAHRSPCCGATKAVGVPGWECAAYGSCAQNGRACLPGKTLSLLAYFIAWRILFCTSGNVRV